MEQAEVVNAGTQDQTNFVPVTKHAHIYQDSVTQKFWFCDETGDASGNGPFEDVTSAEIGLANYVESMEVEHPELASLTQLLGSAIRGKTNIAEGLHILAQKLARQSCPTVTAEERDAAAKDAVAEVYAYCEIGRQFDLKQYPTQDAAFLHLVSHVVAANIEMDENYTLDMLTTKGFKCVTPEDCAMQLHALFVHQAYDEVVDVDTTTIYERPNLLKELVKTCNDMWDHINVEENGSRDADHSQKAVSDKVGATVMAVLHVLSTSKLAKQGKTANELVLEFVHKWQENEVHHQLFRSDVQGALRIFLDKGLAAPIRTTDDALRYFTQAVVGLRCTIRAEGEPLSLTQKWAWNDEQAAAIHAEAAGIIKQMLDEYDNRTAAEATRAVQTED